MRYDGRNLYQQMCELIPGQQIVNTAKLLAEIKQFAHTQCMNYA